MKLDETLKFLVKNNIKNDSIPMLLGEPGIGKSSWAEGLADELNVKIFTLACNQLAEKADLTGTRLIKDDNGEYKQYFYPHQVISDAIEYAKLNPRETSLLFLDEINRTSADVTSALLSLATQRMIGSKKLPNNLKMIIAGNDKGNVVSLDQASISRFNLYHIEPSTETFISIHQDLNPYIKNVLTKEPELIFCKQVVTISEKDDNKDTDTNNDIYEDVDLFEIDEDMEQIATPRTIAKLSRFLNDLSQDDIKNLMTQTDFVRGEEKSILQEVIEGFTGQTLFSAKLLLEIIESQNKNIVTNAQQFKMAKPNIYDDLKNQQSVDDIEDMVENQLTEKEKEDCLIYALTEKEDNYNIISILHNYMTTFSPNGVKNLMAISQANDFDKDNVECFLNNNSTLTQSVALLLSI